MTTKQQSALAELIRERRTALGLSGREVARRARVDNATVSLLELGRIANPRVTTVRAIAEVLELPLADVYEAADWLPDAALPSLRPYMRAKYGDLSDAELAQIEAFVAQVSAAHQRGPSRGEDE